MAPRPWRASESPVLPLTLVVVALLTVSRLRAPSYDSKRVVADVLQSHERLIESLDSINDPLRSLDATELCFAISELQSKEADGDLSPKDAQRSVAEALAEELAPYRPAIRSMRNPVPPQVEVLAHDRFSWKGYDVTVRRISDGGRPGATWAGEWLILLVRERGGLSSRSIAALTSRPETIWVSKEAAAIDDVVAALDGGNEGDGLELDGWREASPASASGEDLDVAPGETSGR